MIKSKNSLKFIQRNWEIKHYLPSTFSFLTTMSALLLRKAADTFRVDQMMTLRCR